MASQKGKSTWRVSVDPPSASAFRAIFAQVSVFSCSRRFPPIRLAFSGRVKQKFGPGRPVFCSSSPARGNAREILNAAPGAVLHDVESAVSRTKKFFGCVAILGKGGDSRADR